jgi:hypothetical protein
MIPDHLQVDSSYEKTSVASSDILFRVGLPISALQDRIGILLPGANVQRIASHILE